MWGHSMIQSIAEMGQVLSDLVCVYLWQWWNGSYPYPAKPISWIDWAILTQPYLVVVNQIEIQPEQREIVLDPGWVGRSS